MRAGLLPKDWHIVPAKLGVVRQQRATFDHGLCHEQPVKRVRVMRGQLAYAIKVLGVDRQHYGRQGKNEVVDPLPHGPVQP